MHIVCDIGGTNMRVAAVVDGALGAIQKVPTPKDPLEGIARFVALVRECAGTDVVESVCGCIAGTVDDAGVLSDARNLGLWEGTPIVQEFSKALGAPVDLVNDAALAGFGEAYAGAGKGARRLAYITVSTGVGGGLIVDGEIAASGGIGDIDIGGAHLESLVSGTAVRQRFGIEPKDLDSLEIRNALADTLAEGLRIVVRQWSPDTIVLGGSMIVGMNPIPLERVQASLRALLADQMPVVKMAELGDNGGLWGGLARLRRNASGTSPLT